MTSAGLLDTRPARVLAIAGLALIIAGMTFGEVFAIFILHPTIAAIGEAMYAAAHAVSAGDADAVLGRFQTIGGLLESRGSKIAAHNHAVIVGFLAIMLACLQSSTSWTPVAKQRLAWIYVGCAVLLPIAVFAIHYVGLAYSPFSYFGWASIVANMAGLAIAVVVILQLLGWWRGRGQMVALDSAIAGCLTRDGRVLMAGGLLLLLGGFLFGFGAAAYFKYLAGFDEAALLRDIVSHAAAGQSFDADFAAYGGMQAVQGVIVAAHAHVNTMGLLLLVLAPVQSLVLLADDWRRRWTLALVISSFATPVCILLELKWGLLAGRLADLSGAVSIAALAAMLMGMLRYNAARGSAGEGARG